MFNFFQVIGPSSYRWIDIDDSQAYAINMDTMECVVMANYGVNF
jgi:hypothetical protein